MKNNILPIKQRRLLYQKALELMVQSYKDKFYWFGLCFYLSSASKELNIPFRAYCPYFGLNMLPEIIRFKPRNLKDSIWFPYDKLGKANRIRILQDAIKLAEPKPRIKIKILTKN